MIDMKPIVDCVLLLPEDYLAVGGHALLKPSNHPNHLEEHCISNENPVHTSKIIAFDLAERMIETQNTIYRYNLLETQE